jgi:hypothetical protein
MQTDLANKDHIQAGKVKSVGILDDKMGGLFNASCAVLRVFGGI